MIRRIFAGLALACLAVAALPVIAVATDMVPVAFAQETTSKVAESEDSGGLEEIVVQGFRKSLEASLDIKRDAIGSVDALLAAQSVETATEEERRQARARGDDILDRLDELRHGLLAGTLTRGQVVALANLVRSRRGSIVDPKLRELLDEIELRAEVEIAKLDNGGSSS